ncbi:MAG TPA: phosphoenolpyruvate--protein phosphotransferase [Lachnospiraceae bacterium]|nr:phosphoenolpyruvate--protein phosphotransferase [Lachnospiraceae bacterium]
MEVFQGIPVFGGIAEGEIFFFPKDKRNIVCVRISNVEKETERYEKACEQIIEQLDVLYEKALTEFGESRAKILDIYKLIVQDREYRESVKSLIRDKRVNAEYAVNYATDELCERFLSLGDEYLRVRTSDIRDISGKIIDILNGDTGTRADSIKEPVIAVADELTPSETIKMDKSKILAIVTKQGSTISHTSILAKTMNIPAIIGVTVKKGWNGRFAIIDGYTGQIFIDPDEETRRLYNEKRSRAESIKRQYSAFKSRQDITKGGRRVLLCANISDLSDVDAAVESNAAGIGLLRSEFLYLKSGNYPTEDEQFEAYKSVALKMNNKEVVIRTCDMGGDKIPQYMHMPRESNPAMGYRGIRLSLDRKDMLITQLRAIYRASAYGNISVMYPLIISLDEVMSILKINEEVKEELAADKLPFGKVRQGIMIETPAAAIISDILAEQVDFLSIGTNDLTQYTLAVDRQNARIDKYYDSDHPAILRLIRMTVENAHRLGKKVSICGELAADLSLTDTFIEMGVDGLSVSVPYIYKLREHIINSEL